MNSIVESKNLTSLSRTAKNCIMSHVVRKQKRDILQKIGVKPRVNVLIYGCEKHIDSNLEKKDLFESMKSSKFDYHLSQTSNLQELILRLSDYDVDLLIVHSCLVNSVFDLIKEMDNKVPIVVVYNLNDTDSDERVIGLIELDEQIIEFDEQIDKCCRCMSC